MTIIVNVAERDQIFSPAKYPQQPPTRGRQQIRQEQGVVLSVDLVRSDRNRPETFAVGVPVPSEASERVSS